MRLKKVEHDEILNQIYFDALGFSCAFFSPCFFMSVSALALGMRCEEEIFGRIRFKATT